MEEVITYKTAGIIAFMYELHHRAIGQHDCTLCMV